MQYFTDIKAYESSEKTAVTLGKFDSLHRGHQKLIAKVRDLSEQEALKSVVFSFDMNSETLLTNQERREHLEMQVDCMIQCPFTKEIREMEAECFIEEVLVKRLHAAYIVVGSDFRFGHGKKGDSELLKNYATRFGYHLEVLDKELYKECEISSTFVREALQKGEVELGNELLGYTYHMSGVVQPGKRLGRRLGFPTMNITPGERKIMPRFGVYICRILMNGQAYRGIGNVGTKPTVTDQLMPLIEVYVFDYEGDAYGETIRVEFCSFVRPEAKFDSIEALKKQVDQDIEYCALHQK